MANAMGHHGPPLLGHLCEEPRCIQCRSCLATSFDTGTPTLSDLDDEASELILDDLFDFDDLFADS